MSKNDGGPAFPIHGGDPGWRDGNGMSLRDYFAGQAMSGYLFAHPHTMSWHYLAKEAYEIADAMLEARKRGAQEISTRTDS